MDFEKAVGAGVVGLLGMIVTWLFARRGSSHVKHRNAQDERESSFQDNLQARYEAAMGRISQLTAERDELKAELEQARTKLTVVQMVADNDPKRAVEITRDSAFVDMSRPLKLRPAVRPPSSHDVFQANVEYTPPPPPPRRK